ncbi:MAG: nitroreductase family deazaflavin-dependent oxidoreductase [Candidatus Binataceae bacterium]
MESDLTARLSRVSGNQTVRLTHYGRKSAKAYQVTIWFVVEGDIVYLVTANRNRQWTRNVLKKPQVSMRIGDETFAGKVEPITDSADKADIMDLVGRKYWYAFPYVWIGRMLTDWGLVTDRTAAFRVRLDTA